MPRGGGGGGAGGVGALAPCGAGLNMPLGGVGAAGGPPKADGYCRGLSCFRSPRKSLTSLSVVLGPVETGWAGRLGSDAMETELLSCFSTFTIFPIVFLIQEGPLSSAGAGTGAGALAGTGAVAFASGRQAGFVAAERVSVGLRTLLTPPVPCRQQEGLLSRHRIGSSSGISLRPL